MAAIVEGEPLRRFLVFAWSNHYPGGGLLGDFEGQFDEVFEAIEFAVNVDAKGLNDHVEVFDIQQSKTVWRNP